jgi:glycosyltransferase involved in cell wall biosynthesis
MKETPSSLKPPIVSVVVPVYNGERFVPEMIRSMQAQTFREWDCVIVDDGSKDNTLALIHSLIGDDPRFRAVSQANQGPSAARNYGLTLIDPRSQYVTFMDSDDIWMPDALEVLVAAIERDPVSVGAHALGRCIDEFSREYEDPAYASQGSGRYFCDTGGTVVRLDPEAPTSFQSLWFSNPYPPGLLLTRRSVLEKVGGFDLSVCPLEDWDMNLRLSRHGGFQFVEKVILSYRRHPNNLSGQSASLIGKRIRNLYHKTFFSAENTEAQKAIVRQNWRATEMLYMRQKAGSLKGHLSKPNVAGILSGAAGVFLHLFRGARGYPTLQAGEQAARRAQKNPDIRVGHNPT